MAYERDENSRLPANDNKKPLPPGTEKKIDKLLNKWVKELSERPPRPKGKNIVDLEQVRKERKEARRSRRPRW